MKVLEDDACSRLLFIVFALACATPPALAMECPAPPVQSRKDWDTEVKAEVGRIGFVRGAQLETRVRSATQDLMGKLPGADRVYLEQMMFSAYCTALREDPKISGAEKSKQILEYRRALSAAIQTMAKKTAGGSSK
jgi:uncharacterized protein